MKKYLIGMVVVAGIILMMMCWYKESHRVRIPRYREVKMITWEKLDTFVLSNPTFKVVYPDNFEVDSSQLKTGYICFTHIIGGLEVSLRSFSSPNDGRWNTEVAADSAVYYRINLTNDSVTQRDMHDGYFYLSGFSKVMNYRFYEQYVVDEDNIYVLELLYAKGIPEEKLERLKNLVHDWNPK